MTHDLRGVLTALAIPFGADGSIDTGVLRQVVDRSIDGGVHGVVACGSTGEFAAMTGDERRLVVETVVEHTAGRVPVVAQTGAVATREAIALSQHAEAAGASVVMLVTPYYEALTEVETVRYLSQVAGSIDIPVMLYNLPGATGVNLTPELVGRLADEIPNIRYIKDTSADMAQAGQLIHQLGDRVGTFIGWDSLTLASLTEGAAGVMAGTANIFPTHLVGIYDAIAAGDLALAKRRWDVLYPLMDAIMTAPFIQAVKSALVSLGIPVGPPREPLLPLDDETAARIAALVAALPPVE